MGEGGGEIAPTDYGAIRARRLDELLADHVRAKQQAEDLEAELLRLEQEHAKIDPVGTDWSRLMRRAPAKSRKYLKDAALQAMDLRIAAEILLLFYEDLAEHDHAEPLPDLSASLGWWHPLMVDACVRRNRRQVGWLRCGAEVSAAVSAPGAPWMPQRGCRGRAVRPGSAGSPSPGFSRAICSISTAIRGSTGGLPPRWG